MNELRQTLSYAFIELVAAEFSFLESSFGYQLHQTHPPDKTLSHGDCCRITYGNSAVGIAIEIFLDFEIYYADIILVESPNGIPVKHSVWGQSHLASAVLLGTLRTWRGSSDPSEKFTTASFFSLDRRHPKTTLENRRSAIIDDLPSIVQMLACRLRESALDVICGDTSMFQAVQEYYRNQQRVTLSSDGERVEFEFGKPKS